MVLESIRVEKLSKWNQDVYAYLMMVLDNVNKFAVEATTSCQQMRSCKGRFLFLVFLTI